jgi:hypothetical protein
MNLASNGDISFYEDTGTTAKLFWDASAESLTVGQSNNFSNALANDLQVGTTSGSHGITIVGQNTASANLFFADNNNNDRGKISYSHASDALSFTVASAERMRIDASGRVGIGTSSPSAKVHAVGDNSDGTNLATSASNAKVRFQNHSNSSLSAYQGYTGNSSWYTQIANSAGTSSYDLSLNPYGGRVGIGTSSPSSSLHITASHPTVYLETSGGGATDAAYLQKYSNDVYLYNKESAGNLYLGTDNATKVTLDSSGRVGIGTSSPSLFSDTQLMVRNDLDNAGIGIATGQSGKSARLRFFDNSGNQDATIGIEGTGNALFFTTVGGGESMRIDSSGNLLVGTTSTLHANTGGLHVKATGSLHAMCVQAGGNGYGVVLNNSAGAVVGSIVMSASATSYNTSSDQRLKENIADADDAGSKIDSIQVRKYDWRADGSHQDYGMIAQELQTVAPEAVSGDADSEEMMGVDYSKLVPMLIKEIQSLRNRVAQLEE